MSWPPRRTHPISRTLSPLRTGSLGLGRRRIGPESTAQGTEPLAEARGPEWHQAGAQPRYAARAAVVLSQPSSLLEKSGDCHKRRSEVS